MVLSASHAAPLALPASQGKPFCVSSAVRPITKHAPWGGAGRPAVSGSRRTGSWQARRSPAGPRGSGSVRTGLGRLGREGVAPPPGGDGRGGPEDGLVHGAAGVWDWAGAHALTRVAGSEMETQGTDHTNERRGTLLAGTPGRISADRQAVIPVAQGDSRALAPCSVLGDSLAGGPASGRARTRMWEASAGRSVRPQHHRR